MSAQPIVACDLARSSPGMHLQTTQLVYLGLSFERLLVVAEGPMAGEIHQAIQAAKADMVRVRLCSRFAPVLLVFSLTFCSRFCSGTAGACSEAEGHACDVPARQTEGEKGR